MSLLRIVVGIFGFQIFLIYIGCGNHMPYKSDIVPISKGLNLLDTYSMIINQNPKDDHAYMRRCKEYIRQGNYNEAINDVNKALDLNPRINEYFLLKGYLYELMGDTINADQSFAGAIILDKNVEWIAAFIRGGVIKNELECIIPMANQGGVWVIPVTVNNNPDTLKFAVDTGGWTIINPRIANKLHIDADSKMYNSPIGKIRGVRIDRIAIGDWVFTNTTAAISSELDCSVDGIIGANILSKSIVTIDGQTSELTIGDIPRPRNSAFECDITISLYDLFQPIVKSIISGHDQELLCIDTGFRGGILLSDKINSTGLSPHEDTGIFMNKRFVGVQKFKIFPKVLDQMSIGPLEMTNVYIGQGGDRGVIGNSFLRNFRVTVDYLHGKLLLDPYKRQVIIDKSWYHLIRGNGFCLASQFKDALYEYSMALGENPDCLDPYIYTGRIYYTDGKYTEAIKYYTMALQRSPRMFGLLRLRSQAYFQAGNWAQGMADYYEAERMSREDGDDSGLLSN